MKSAQKIIKAAADSSDETDSDKAFNTVNDLLFRFTNQPEETESLKEAQSILKGVTGVRHAADCRERGDAARIVLRGLI